MTAEIIQAKMLKRYGWLDSLVEGKPFNDVVGNQHCNHQTVNGYDTRHDHRDDGLHDELRPHDRHGSDACAALGRAISCAQGW